MDTLFNPSTLSAAKDVGIPISVLVGVLAIFGAIAALKATLDRRVFFTIVGFGAIVVACLMFILWLSTKEVYQWIDTKALADWAGNDEGWTDGRASREILRAQPRRTDRNVLEQSA